MKFTATPLNDAYLIDLETREDERGFFARYFCEKEFCDAGLNTTWVQVNNSLSKTVGTLRGLHYQILPHSEVKIVRCIKGAIWDVIVDMRNDSTTFGQWYGTELNSNNRTMMYVPKGFAHGFVTLQPDSEIIYMVSNRYEPLSERTLIWSDETVAINWPITPLIISDKDKMGQQFKDLVKI
ncbi:MAG: dTDP-4-dehydrorhamnose 3,5-epimerase [Flavobacterium sp.]|uniref:dTDP-4-dehydrorhamnose 3,5-epimerase n=1 Tax=Flavobacterium sp. TaxID=239 RepID=UPI003BC7A8FF